MSARSPHLAPPVFPAWSALTVLLGILLAAAIPAVASAQEMPATMRMFGDGAGSPAPAGAQESNGAEAAAPAEEGQRRGPFDGHLAIGTYLTGWAGSYLGGGVGGRLRWEPFDELGVEVFGEGLLVESPAGLRHDWPVGFNLYIPVELDPAVRLRPLFGFCAVFSFVEPEQEHAPRSDDILFGIHGGLGVEVAVHSMWTLFLDAQVNGWLGHDRAAGGWTGGVDGDYSVFWNAQLYAGAQLHFDL